MATLRTSPLAQQAAALLAVDPLALGGVRLRGGAGPHRDAWLARVRETLPPAMPWQRLPVSIEEERLLGGLDLAASLAARRSIAQRGLLAQCHGGVLVASMAERLPLRVATALAGVLDRRELIVEREGLGERQPAHLAVIALDEAGADDEPLAPALADRLALDVVLMEPLPEAAGRAVADATAIAAADTASPAWPEPEVLQRARATWSEVEVPDAMLEALCQATRVLGIDSARAAWWALQVARMHAALTGRPCVADDDAALAVALVLAPRATRLPAPSAAERTEDLADERGDDRREAGEAGEPAPDDARAAAEPAPAEAGGPVPLDAPPVNPADARALEERLVAAALAALPPGLLARLASGALREAGAARRTRSGSEGRSGALALSRRRGAPLGTRPGDPRRGERLSLVETLRAAIPWQRLRTVDSASAAGSPAPAAAAPSSAATAPKDEGPRLSLRMDDLRVVRRAQHRRSTTIFLVDASGSAAVHRLAEAKGAVEQLLAESYVRRDEVAVIAFRGPGAELLLPPTRSLVRARRALAGLPGGGGTPIAAALDAAEALVEQVQRRGATPSVVLLTDGRANVARDPVAGRAQAEADALAAARRLAARGARALLIDTSPRPAEAAARLAVALGARYLPLPHVRADLLSSAVRQLAS